MTTSKDYLPNVHLIPIDQPFQLQIPIVENLGIFTNKSLCPICQKNGHRKDWWACKMCFKGHTANWLAEFLIKNIENI